MLLIETFMLEPAKLATNCVSANGNMSLRLAAAPRGVLGCDTRQVSPGLPTSEADTTPVAEDARIAAGLWTRPIGSVLRLR